MFVWLGTDRQKESGGMKAKERGIKVTATMPSLYFNRISDDVVNGAYSSVAEAVRFCVKAYYDQLDTVGMLRVNLLPQLVLTDTKNQTTREKEG